MKRQAEHNEQNLNDDSGQKIKGRRNGRGRNS